MKKTVFALLMSLIPLYAFTQNIFISDNLTKKWETGRELKVPESVFYDNLKDAIYVSNINGKPTDKDNNGFISKLSPDGQITRLEWIQGLHAPKGMGVVGNLLYVSDIDRVAEIDITQGKILRMIEIPGSAFLNDIATDSKGNVYVSDSQNGDVHIIRQGKADMFAKSDKLEGINGLYVYEGSLLAGVKDRIVKIDLNSKEITDYILNTGGIDGLVPDGKEGFIISDWTGNVNKVGIGKKKMKLLDTTSANINAADIEFVAASNLILVPTFTDNRVVAYELK